MRIERADDGRILAKCFRCGQYGIDDRYCGTVNSIRQTISRTEGGDTDSKEKDNRLGAIEYRSSEWPVLAYHWLRQYEIVPKEFGEYNVGYAKERQRIYLPIWWNGERVGYQLRKIFDNDTGPKYDSHVKGGYGFMSLPDVTNNEIVIVEDIVSAIKVGRQAKAVALLSTGMTQTIKAALSHYDKFYVWLDMDNPQVIRQAVKLLNALKIFGEAKLIHTPKDPKCYSDEEIARLLYAT